MSLLVQVRAEIKSWERDFASTHGRDPSVQDIRDQPDIAEKYKLYKKLSKATHTPPRTNSRLPAPKSRPVESVSPLPGFNPFSPVKRSTKHASRASPTFPHVDPFATPAKISRRTAASPDATFPPHSNVSPHDYPVSTTAVSRARKRLRGEPVSPSPNKPKRQRVPSQASPPLPTSEQNSSNSEHETDQELPQCNFISSFVADSPVKAPAGGKSFKLLFDDILPALPVAKKPTGPFVARLDSAPNAHLSKRATTDRSVLASLKPRHDLRSNSGPEYRLNRVRGKFPTQIFPTEDHSSASSHNLTSKLVVPQVSQTRTSMKRALDSSDPVSLQVQYPLIPPSPPSHDSINRDVGKGKAKTTAGRKKLRVEDEDNDEDVDPDGIAVKVATVSLDRGKHRHADDPEWDPLLHLGARNHDPTATEQIDANHHASGTFTVDLPDELRRVLAISPSRNHNSTEERVVRGLLYGDRVGHYDPSRGGAIWDAGETDEGALGDAETEDDWEGEPVPWEAGEL